MNKESAWVRLGLSGREDAATIARIYGERLSAVQERLVAAQTEADRSASQTTLSELVDAYEFVTASGRYTRASNDSSATVLRSDVNAATGAAHDALIRMEPGAVLSGRLEVGVMLGQGGMGNVYAARDRLKDEDVAIKVLRQDLLFSEAAKERFLAEAKVSCKLSHPNIVRVYDVGMSGDCYYFSMERLEGRTLRQRIDEYEAQHREFGVSEATDIARQLIDALRYAHRYIVHRDLKPENIWLCDDGTVKLMDFGIARAYSNSQLTQTGMTLGTAYYMAPEQRAASKEVDWRADQYALGVVLYELLAGTLPTGAVRPIETLRRDLPKRYARALMKAMAPKPADRFGSFDELWNELQAPARRAFALGGLLLLGAGVAAAAGGAYVIYNRQALPIEPVPIVAAGERAAGPAASWSDSSPGSGSTGSSAQGGEGRSSSGNGSNGSNGNGNGNGNSNSNSSPMGGGDDGGSSNPVNAVFALPGGVESQTDLADTGPAVSVAPTGAAPAGVSGDPEGAAQVASRAENPGRPAKADSPASGIAASVSAQQGVASSVDARREACVAQCARDEGECRSLNRRGRQDCMRTVGFGGNAGVAGRNPASASCAFFGAARCDLAADHGACIARVSQRQEACVDMLGGTIVSQRQDCEDISREADRFCMDELRECRAAC